MKKEVYTGISTKALNLPLMSLLIGALGGQVGRVMKLGKQPVKLFGEVLYNPEDDNGPNAEWSVKANITFLLPK